MAAPSYTVAADELVGHRFGARVTVDDVFAADDHYRLDKWRRLEEIGSIKAIVGEPEPVLVAPGEPDISPPATGTPPPVAAPPAAPLTAPALVQQPAPAVQGAPQQPTEAPRTDPTPPQPERASTKPAPAS